MDKIKYSVIGTSWITKAFIEGASKLDSLELLGVCSRSLEKGRAFALEVGAKEVYTSVEAVAKSTADFIYVASPNVCHYEQCKCLLEHKKNVICEKPITITARQFQELFSIAEKNHLIYFEAIMYMHSPARNLLRAKLPLLGNISTARFDFSQLSSRYAALLAGETPNIFNPAMKTGALNDLGIYCVYPTVDLFGDPDEIHSTQYFVRTGADGAGTAAFEYSDKLINITYSKLGQSRIGSEIMGDNGTITIESISKLINVFFYDNGGDSELLCGEIEKRDLMCNEALSMVQFLTDFEHSRGFYYECADMSGRVLVCLEKMRKKLL